MMSEESYKDLQEIYGPGPYVCPFCRREAGNHEIRGDDVLSGVTHQVTRLQQVWHLCIGWWLRKK